MKKSIITTLSAVAIICSGVIIYRVASHKNNYVFNRLVEVLTDGESRIGIGGVCAYDLNSWCIYYDPYEEYPGTLVADPEIGPWQ